MARRAFVRGAALQVLGLVGVVMLGAGITLLHFRRGLFESDAFAHRLSTSLADPRVSAFVADRITDTVIQHSPDLSAFRPLVRGAAQGVVESAGFRTAFRAAARTAHHTVFAEGTREVLLSLEDLDVLLRSALVHASPEIAEKIPRGLTTVVTSVGDSQPAHLLLEVSRLGRRLAAFGGLLVGLGLVLLAGRVLLAPDRERGLHDAAVDVAGAGLLIALLVPVGRMVVLQLADDPVAAAAVAGVFDAFAAGLRNWALSLAGIGLVFGAAARSLLEDLTVPDALRRGVRFLEDPPGGTRGRLVRAFLLLAAGTVAWLYPEAAISATTLLAGAGLGFLGLLELFRIVQRALVDPSVGRGAAAAGEGDVAAGGRVSRPGVVRAITVLGVAGALALMVGWLGRPAPPRALPVASEACNGHIELCGRRLDEVVLAGTHNSMAAMDVPRFMFPQHERSVADQLALGVRAFLIDTYYGRQVIGEEWVKTDLEDTRTRALIEAQVGPDGTAAAMRIRDRLTGKAEGPRAIFLCHGFCELGAVPFVPWLRTLRDFMVANPAEVVVLVLEDHVLPEDIAADVRESGLEGLVYRRRPGPPWPTLRELVVARERALLFLESGRPGVEWLLPAFTSIQETPFAFRWPKEMSCAPNRGEPSASLFQMNHWIYRAPAPMPSDAAVVNAYDFLMGRARQCQEERKMLPNILAVDFYRTGDLFRVVRDMNGLSEGSGLGGRRSEGPRDTDPLRERIRPSP